MKGKSQLNLWEQKGGIRADSVIDGFRGLTARNAMKLERLRAQRHIPGTPVCIHSWHTRLQRHWKGDGDGDWDGADQHCPDTPKA